MLLGVEDDGEVIGLPPKLIDAMIRNFVKVMNEDDVFRLVVPLDDGYSADQALKGALTKTAQETAQENLSDIELKILSCIEMDSEITRKLIAEKIGISADSVKR